MKPWEMNGKQLYAWTQRETALLREKLQMNKISFEEFKKGRKRIENAWSGFRREKETQRPVAREYTQHYPKSFLAPLHKVDSEE